MAETSSASESRNAARQRVLKTGKLVFGNNHSIVDCTIRNMSKTGAKILCGDQSAVPSLFKLVTTSDNLMRDAKVIWRRGNEIGIRFSGDPHPAPARI